MASQMQWQEVPIMRSVYELCATNNKLTSDGAGPSHVPFGGTQNSLCFQRA